jgi:hypothetical protein
MSPQPARFPPLEPSELTGDAKQAHAYSRNVADSFFGSSFTHTSSSGAMVGPYAPLLRTPAAVQPYFDLCQRLAEIPNLPRVAREVAILCVGYQYGAEYEIYAHSRLAIEAGLGKDAVRAICTGQRGAGKGWTLECDLAWDVAVELAKGKGKLGDETFKRCVGILGEEGTLALIHYVGFYGYTCVLLNGCGVGVPEGEERLP